MTPRLPALLRAVPTIETANVVTLLREIIVEIRGLRADLRKHSDAASGLIVAIADDFGDGRFTAAGLLAVAADEPHGAVADALAAVVDMSASPRSRATALGLLLARLPEVETVAAQRGCAVYRLRTSPD